MFTVYAKNLKTAHIIELDSFETEKEAQWNIDYNIEWDEDDDPTEWLLYIRETEDEDYDYDDADLECGFDPYMGCYSDDC